MVQTRRDPEQRPSPEALLEAARREDSRAGRLKIFVGAAPGVGKTYEMLQSAHAKKKAGADVVVGIVETHGRAETEALLKGLDVLPRRRLAYREQTLEEMDLDALIARRPQIALVEPVHATPSDRRSVAVSVPLGGRARAPGSRAFRREGQARQLRATRRRARCAGRDDGW